MRARVGLFADVQSGDLVPRLHEAMPFRRAFFRAWEIRATPQSLDQPPWALQIAGWCCRSPTALTGPPIRHAARQSVA
jgi:hypothetical protein